ncbi:MAG: hypothetical protein Q7V88_11240 [Actinomycetota bacterium]|nr:hypothetical protein [Actinomycetota bacterium]
MSSLLMKRRTETPLWHLNWRISPAVFEVSNHRVSVVMLADGVYIGGGLGLILVVVVIVLLLR